MSWNPPRPHGGSSERKFELALVQGRRQLCPHVLLASSCPSHILLRRTGPLSWLVRGTDGYAEQICMSVNKPQPSPQRKPHRGWEGETSALPWPEPPSENPGVRLTSPQLPGAGLSPSTHSLTQQQEGHLCFLFQRHLHRTGLQENQLFLFFFLSFFFAPKQQAHKPPSALHITSNSQQITNPLAPKQTALCS